MQLTRGSRVRYIDTTDVSVLKEWGTITEISVGISDLVYYVTWDKSGDADDYYEASQLSVLS